MYEVQGSFVCSVPLESHSSRESSSYTSVQKHQVVIPDLRAADPNRQGITADTVCLEDLVGSFVKSVPDGIRLAHQDALVSLSKNIDRHSLTGESVFGTRALDDLRAVISVLDHQLLIAKMLRTRMLKTRLVANRAWMNGQNPIQDEQGEGEGRETTGG